MSDFKFAVGALLGLAALTSLLFMMAIAPARAADDDEPVVKCKEAIFDRLRDPDSAKALYAERIVTKTPKGYLVVLPVRGTNGFGASTKETFVCAYQDGKVVELQR